MDKSTNSITRTTRSFIRTTSRIKNISIIGYLYPTHNPNKAYTQGKYRRNDGTTSTGSSHPLDYLAATNRTIRADVMEWSRIFLSKHSDITRYKPLKDPKTQAKRNLLRGRGGLLVWSEKYCVFCGKKAARSAILMNGLRCCNRCDGREWSGKITKTNAKKNYSLKDYHLFPADCPTPRMDAVLARDGMGMPTVRYGTFWNTGVLTTMFIRTEIEVLAELAYGELWECFQKKKIDLRYGS